MFGEKVRDCCRKKIKFLTFLINDLKIKHHRGLTSFGKQEWFGCVNSPVYCVIISCNDRKSWITSQINKLFLVQSVPLHEYITGWLLQMDNSSRLFHQHFKDITHDRGITWFGEQEQLRLINSPLYYFIISQMTLESAITSQIIHFILVRSKCISIIPGMRHNLLPFSCTA